MRKIIKINASGEQPEVFHSLKTFFAKYNEYKKQKENICKGVTEVIAREAAKPPEAILIFIDEVEHENIAKGGTLLQAPK